MPAVAEVLYWREIPAAVKARGPFGSARAELPTRFDRAIRSAARELGIDDADELLQQYYWQVEGEREGSAAYCAKRLAQEIADAYPPSRLSAMVELAEDYEHAPPEPPVGREKTVTV